MRFTTLLLASALVAGCSSKADGTGGAEDSSAAGTDGVDGSDGSDGADGSDGSDGSDGTDGTDGSDGSDGADGSDGGSATNGTPPDRAVPAPDFVATNRDGTGRDREDLLGHPTVIWFYPAAGTAG